MITAEIGVLLDNGAAERRRSLGLNVFQAYLGELLAQAGIRYRLLQSADELAGSGCRIVLIALAEDNAAARDAMLRYMEQGGGLISYGGLGGFMAAQMGCRVGQEITDGYAELPGPDGSKQTLRFTQAVPWRRLDGAAAGQDGQGALTMNTPHGEAAGCVLQTFQEGRGFLDRWAVDIPTTVVELQQGSKPVVEDGPPAPDGSAGLNDGFLKADDVHELDWHWDRRLTETGQPYFAFPYADMWREMLVHHLLKRALGQGLTLPFVGYWPEGVRQVAVVSHDSDGNLDEEAEATLRLLEECGIRSTWCMLEPGYSPSVYPRIREAGHELAFHYNAVAPDNGIWDGDEFARQMKWLRQALELGTKESVTNKNHLTRMEGWGEFFRWCEREGVTADSSRGPSKKGNVGFLFGTCHPYFPMAWADEGNRLYDVLEIGFLTQDMDHGKWADSSVIVPFLEAVSRVEGVAHFLVHQYHIYRREEVRSALRRIVEEARAQGYVFWTVRQIEQWQRERRSFTGQLAVADGTVTMDEQSGIKSGQPVVWIPVGPDDTDTNAETEVKFGVRCRKAPIGTRSSSPI